MPKSCPGHFELNCHCPLETKIVILVRDDEEVYVTRAMDAGEYLMCKNQRSNEDPTPKRHLIEVVGLEYPIAVAKQLPSENKLYDESSFVFGINKRSGNATYYAAVGNMAWLNKDRLAVCETHRF